MPRERAGDPQYDGSPGVDTPTDDTLQAYDRRIGALVIEDQVVGHVASVVREMRFPSRQRWLWFTVVWPDGSRELPFEDYGPGWHTVRELEAGYLAYHLQSTVHERRLLGRHWLSARWGASQTFGVRWLEGDVAARRWLELGLRDEDF
ncbi:hypothetical protein ACI2K6_00635 [Microbacterium sp. NPDC006705]|uniref:hypothetical protein n=1 Tax=Microbacterium TaxID=33882 RepID=UPI002B47C02A|nr:hypothetical protein [Microbacterium plantarum]WRK15975.1 hypothetical protein VC184_08510 [Microbacterium plantarum]